MVIRYLELHVKGEEEADKKTQKLFQFLRKFGEQIVEFLLPSGQILSDKGDNVVERRDDASSCSECAVQVSLQANTLVQEVGESSVSTTALIEDGIFATTGEEFDCGESLHLESLPKAAMLVSIHTGHDYRGISSESKGEFLQFWFSTLAVATPRRIEHHKDLLV